LKIVQVIVVSLAIGMLASIGMATAEIYFVDSLGGIFGSSSIAPVPFCTEFYKIVSRRRSLLDYAKNIT